MKNTSRFCAPFVTLLLLLTLLNKMQAQTPQVHNAQLTLLQHFVKTASWLKDLPAGKKKNTYTPLIKLNNTSLEDATMNKAMPSSWRGTWKNEPQHNHLELLSSHVFFQNGLHRLVFVATLDENLFCYLITPDFKHKMLLLCPQGASTHPRAAQCFVLTPQKFDLANTFFLEKVEPTSFPPQLWGDYQLQPNNKPELSAQLQADRIHALNREWTVLSTGTTFKDQHLAYYVLAMDQRTGFAAYLQLYKPTPPINNWELCLYSEFNVDGFRTNGHVLGQRFVQLNAPQLIPVAKSN